MRLPARSRQVWLQPESSQLRMVRHGLREPGRRVSEFPTLAVRANARNEPDDLVHTDQGVALWRRKARTARCSVSRHVRHGTLITRLAPWSPCEYAESLFPIEAAQFESGSPREYEHVSDESGMKGGDHWRFFMRFVYSSSLVLRHQVRSSLKLPLNFSALSLS